MAEAKLNRINLAEKDYEGAASTMCRGCGHDAISASVMRAFFESSVDPRKVVKLSGIGCSSKTPAYFLSQSFGFNAVHGRMSAVATGANMAKMTNFADASKRFATPPSGSSRWTEAWSRKPRLRL